MIANGEVSGSPDRTVRFSDWLYGSFGLLMAYARTYQAIYAYARFRCLNCQVTMNFRWNPNHEFAAVIFVSNWLRDFLATFFHVFYYVSNDITNTF